MWKKASRETPAHEPDTWSDEMICLTNLGNVYKLTYMGAWQRPAAFKPGEEVEYWIETPEKLSAMMGNALLLRADVIGILMLYSNFMHPRVKEALEAAIQAHTPR